MGLLALLMLGFLRSAVAAAPTVPPLKRRCTDLAGLLSRPQAAKIEALLRVYAKRSGHQFAVLIVDDLQGQSLEEQAVRVFEAWKLGKSGKDDGLLLMVSTAKEARGMRIEVGYGLEGVIPDAVAHRTLDEILLPAFRSGAYASGLEAGLRALMQAASGEPGDVQEEQAPAEPAAQGGLGRLLFVLTLGLLSLFFGRGRGGPFGGGGFRLGGGGGGGRDDSFSGGGGRSGGGGASGRW